MIAGPTSGVAVLAARGLRVSFGDLEVLHGVDLELAPGRVVALLGPNGAGKTTLLRALAGVIKVDGGTVVMNGEPFTRPLHHRARAGVGFLGDDRHVFPGLTVRQNLRLVTKHPGEAYLRFPELRELELRRASMLSGGEQQMLAIARCLACRPSVVLIDELSLGLAPLVRKRLLAILREIADSGTAVLVVEQSVRDVLLVADCAAVMRRGEIIDERAAVDWRDLEELGAMYLS